MQNIFIGSFDLFKKHAPDRVYIEDAILSGLLGMSSLLEKIIFMDYPNKTIMFAK